MSQDMLNHQLQAVEMNAGDRVIAFFDLDRTLIAGYSIVAVALERIRHGVTRGELQDSIGILRDLVKHQRDNRIKGPNYQRLVQRLSRSLKGTREETLVKLGEKAYLNSLARNLYSEAIALVEAHRRAGHRLVIVTAATRYQVEPIARVLGIDEVCCTGLEVHDGKFTGKTLAPLCYGEGKAMAARRVCKRTRSSLKTSYFYSDSIDDLPLLRAVGHPVAVNPSEKLAAHAESKGWPQLNFATRGLPDLETLLRNLLTAQTIAATAGLGALTRRFGLGGIGNANRLTQIIGDVGAGFAGLDFEIENAQYLKQNKPAIFIFNHQSMLDGMVLAHLLRKDIVPLVKQEMRDNRVLGPMLSQAGTIFVDREQQDQSRVLKETMAVLESGRSIIIAPEGKRSTLGEIQPFKHGAFYLAKKAGVPVVPIALHNVKDALPNGGLLIRPATIRVTVLPPVLPADMKSIRGACEGMERAYEQLLGKSRRAALPFGVQRRA